MSHIDIKKTMEQTLCQKQEEIRNYQRFSHAFDDPEAAKMFAHFAEAEMLHATQLIDMLKKFN
ncbi:ferritin family protein [Anaerosinus gibii]|uniref:Rubrerythrin family protein n=1 Tax=Selenobaculum gibii TaxID=3054208 RepID=A0A9Y2AI46_9FIRM|nr:rubrerythrin family protein [Selenobaculum gbiensis]WIW69840.1 rubrerythrin family protein [Selenobaculum gbiensis]